MLYYLLQVILFQTLFLWVYDAFLKRETFFNYNRFYLLFTSVLAFALPFIKFPALKPLTVNNGVIQLPEVFIGSPLPNASKVATLQNTEVLTAQSQTPIWQYIIGIGIALALLFFIFKLLKIQWLKQHNPNRWKGNVLMVKLLKSTAAFSFFNTIFIGEQIAESQKQSIYKHELIHIKEKHSIDLMYFEILRVIMWFNPLVYMYQNRIKTLHEYIADAKVAKQLGKSQYYLNLLNEIFETQNCSFTNSFYKSSLIKKRIVMLQKSKSKRQQLAKYALLLPLIFAMLIYTSTEVSAQQKIITNTNQLQDVSDDELIAKYIKEIEALDNTKDGFKKAMGFIGLEKNRDLYIEPREDYLKNKAYFIYLFKEAKERRIKEGTYTKAYEESNKKLLSKFKPYKDYVAWKQTEEAKRHWEEGTNWRDLRLFVNDINNLTATESKRLKAMRALIKTNSNYRKVVYTDGTTTIIEESKIFKDNSADNTETEEVPFAVIDQVPSTKTCNSEFTTQKDLKKCVSDMVTKHVATNFDINIKNAFTKTKTARVFVAFKIDKQGKVIEVKARGPHKALEAEAIRVINTLPQFIPGKQKGKAVVVPYSLPIALSSK